MDLRFKSTESLYSGSKLGIIELFLSFVYGVLLLLSFWLFTCTYIWEGGLPSFKSIFFGSLLKLDDWILDSPSKWFEVLNFVLTLDFLRLALLEVFKSLTPLMFVGGVNIILWSNLSSLLDILSSKPNFDSYFLEFFDSFF